MGEGKEEACPGVVKSHKARKGTEVNVKTQKCHRTTHVTDEMLSQARKGGGHVLCYVYATVERMFALFIKN